MSIPVAQQAEEAELSAMEYAGQTRQLMLSKTPLTSEQAAARAFRQERKDWLTKSMALFAKHEEAIRALLVELEARGQAA